MRKGPLEIKAARETRSGGGPGGFGGPSSSSLPLHFGGGNTSPLPVSDFTFNFSSSLPGTFPIAKDNGNNNPGVRPFSGLAPANDLTSSAGSGLFAGANKSSNNNTNNAASGSGSGLGASKSSNFLDGLAG